MALLAAYISYLARCAIRTLVVFAIFFAVANTVSAATIAAMPLGGSSYAVGQLFSVSVTVNASVANPLNAISGVLAYPTDLLQIVSVDKGSSVINFWISEPAYSNASGRAQFEGGVYNPGFSGTQGKVVTYLFKAKSVGSADIGFATASILANDGQGTNILERTIPAHITITPGLPENTSIPDSVVPPAGITIRSATHPDQTAWYSSAMVALAWDLPTDAVAVRTGVDQYVKSNPSTLTAPAITETTFTLADGTWYFHLQVKDHDGWGAVSTFKINIDSTAVDPPVFDKFPSTLIEGEVLLISGMAPKNAVITMTLINSRGDSRQQSVKSGDDGRFQTIWQRDLHSDSYTLSAEAINARGLKSSRGQDIVITVQPTTLQRVARPVIDYATLVALVAGIVILCFMWIWYLVQRVRHFQKRVRADIKRTNQLIHVHFKKLLDQARSKRRLTAEEERMMSIIREGIQEAEEEVEEEVRDIGQ